MSHADRKDGACLEHDAILARQYIQECYTQHKADVTHTYVTHNTTYNL